MRDKLNSYVDNICNEERLEKLANENSDFGVILGVLFRDMFTSNDYKLPKGVTRLEANSAIIARVRDWYVTKNSSC